MTSHHGAEAPRHRRLAIVVVAVGLLLGVAAAEVVVRLADAAPEVSAVRRGRFQLSANPRLVFEPVPGLEVEEEADGGVPLYFGYPGRANRLGYRDRDHPVAKPAGTYRIVVLGDSVAAGWGVDDTADLFAPRLERLLDRPGRRVEVLNFSVTGYNTAQEVETLASRALAFDPDLVILAYCLNDRWPPDPRLVAALRETAEGEATRGRRPVLADELERGATRALLRSALYRLLRYRPLGDGVELPALDAAGELEAGPVDAQGRPDLQGARVVTGPDGEPISGAAGVRAAFARLAALAAGGRDGDLGGDSGSDSGGDSGGDGFEVLVAIFPHHTRPHSYREHHRQVADFAAEEGFAVLDLVATFEACRRRTGEDMAFDRFHLTVAGHACAARALAGHLRHHAPAALRDPAG